MSLLVTPEELSRELAVVAAAASDRSSACRRILRGPLAGCGSPGFVRHQQHRHRPGSAASVFLDHRTPAGLSRRVEQAARCRVRRDVGHTRGARVLVSRVLRPSEHARARRRFQRLGERAAAASTKHAEKPKPSDWTGHAQRADSRWLARRQRPAAQRRRHHPRHAQRRRVLRHDGPGRARRRHSGSRSPRMDEQSHT